MPDRRHGVYLAEITTLSVYPLLIVANVDLKDAWTLFDVEEAFDVEEPPSAMPKTSDSPIGNNSGCTLTTFLKDKSESIGILNIS